MNTGPAQLVRKVLGNGNAQHGRVLYTVCTADAVLQQQRRLFVCAARHGQQSAAAPHAGVDMLQSYALLCQRLLNGLDSVRQLILDLDELGQLGGVMGDIGFK